MAVILSERADRKDPDIGKVIKMVLLHDIVKIDAGATDPGSLNYTYLKRPGSRNAILRIVETTREEKLLFRTPHTLWQPTPSLS